MKKLLAVFLIVSTLLSLVACGSGIITCPNCGEEVENLAFCPSCGCKLEVKTENVCTVCDKVIEGDAKFCPYCGGAVVSNGNNGNNNSTNNGTNNSTNNSNNDTNVSDVIEETPKTVWLKMTATDDFQKIVYYYDENGNLRGESSTQLSNGKLWSSVEYILDAQGNKVERRRSVPTNNTIGIYNTYTKNVYENKYDSNGRLFSIKETNGRTKKLVSTTEYNYDSQGNIKDITGYYGNGSIDTVTIFENGRIAYIEHREEGRTETYEYDSEGRLIKISMPGYSAEPIVSSGETIEIEDIVTEFTYDNNGNVASENENGSITTYTYMTLEEYVSLNKHTDVIPEMSEFPSYIGSAGCSHCSSHGHDSCIGHDCPVCYGAGVETCGGCHGTGKHAYSHLPNNACVVCYGAGTQICPNCKGAKKKFYTN